MVFCLWGLSWIFSELTPLPVIRDHSWQCCGTRDTAGEQTQVGDLQIRHLPCCILFLVQIHLFYILLRILFFLITAYLPFFPFSSLDF